jgi:hypothetical protein
LSSISACTLLKHVIEFISVFIVRVAIDNSPFALEESDRFRVLHSSPFIISPVRVLSIVLDYLGRIEHTAFNSSEVVLDFQVPLFKLFIVFEFVNEV